MTETTDWGSALAILAAGLIVGAMFVYFFARRRTAAVTSEPFDLELRDLEGKREALIQQLREELPDEERTRLELETAQVLRAIDEHKLKRKAAAPATAAAAPVTPNRAALVGFAWGVGSVLVLGALGYFVMQAAKPREGTEQQTMQQAAPQVDAVVQQLEAAVQKNPEDLNARVDLAQAYLERENLMGVFEQTQYVLVKEPNHPRALTFQALVRMAMGQTPEAVEMLQKATKVDPSLLDAWVGLAWVRIQEGKVKEAEAAMQEAMRRRPDEKQRLEQVLAQMKQHEGVDMSKPAPTPAAAAQTDPSLPPDHPPIGGAPSPAMMTPPAAPAGAVDAKAIRVTLDLDPSSKQRTGVIYVIARPAGATGGPPVAVKRLAGGTLPVTFDLTSADSMMGQPLPAKVRLEARLDSDGDAATKNPSDPQVVQDGVATGSAIKLALK